MLIGAAVLLDRTGAVAGGGQTGEGIVESGRWLHDRDQDAPVRKKGQGNGQGKGKAQGSSGGTASRQGSSDPRYSRGNDLGQGRNAHKRNGGKAGGKP